MPVSVMKFVTIKSPRTEYRLMCFRFGGEEPFFTGKGYRSFDYVAAVMVGPNPALFVDTLFGSGEWSAERAGYYNGDLVAAWSYILKFFDKLPERCVMRCERSADTWEVTKIEEDLA